MVNSIWKAIVTFFTNFVLRWVNPKLKSIPIWCPDGWVHFDNTSLMDQDVSLFDVLIFRREIAQTDRRTQINICVLKYIWSVQRKNHRGGTRYNDRVAGKKKPIIRHLWCYLLSLRLHYLNLKQTRQIAWIMSQMSDRIKSSFRKCWRFNLPWLLPPILGGVSKGELRVVNTDESMVRYSTVCVMSWHDRKSEKRRVGWKVIESLHIDTYSYACQVRSAAQQVQDVVRRKSQFARYPTSRHTNCVSSQQMTILQSILSWESDSEPLSMRRGTTRREEDASTSELHPRCCRIFDSKKNEQTKRRSAIYLLHHIF